VNREGLGVNWFFLIPLTQAEARGEGEGQARSGGARVKRIKTKVQWTFVPLNGLATDGEPRTCKREHGQRSTASPRSPQAQGPVPWANLLSQAPSEGTRGVCGRRVRGALSFGSLLWARKERNSWYGGETPLVTNRRQAQMALGTLAETKVPRLPGRDPAHINRR